MTAGSEDMRTGTRPGRAYLGAESSVRSGTASGDKGSEKMLASKVPWSQQNESSVSIMKKALLAPGLLWTAN